MRSLVLVRPIAIAGGFLLVGACGADVRLGDVLLMFPDSPSDGGPAPSPSIDGGGDASGVIDASPRDSGSDAAACDRSRPFGAPTLVAELNIATNSGGA